MALDTDGERLTVGDTVGFKSDVEQYAVIIEIRGSRLTLKAVSDSGFQGEYLAGTHMTTETADRVWLDG